MRALSLCRWSVTIASLLSLAAHAAPVYDVPRLSGIVIDGRGDEWGDRGFRTQLLGDTEGMVPAVADLDAGFRLGWDERGLLLLITVRDDVAFETNDAIWDNDAIELFLAPKPGATSFYSVMLRPGRDPKRAEPRQRFQDHGASAGRTPPAAETARTRSAGGYVMEVRLPWKNGEITPRAGAEAGFQLYVNDRDSDSKWSHVAFFPRDRTHEDTTRMHRLRLAERAGAPLQAVAGGTYERFRRTRVRVTAVADRAGRGVEVRAGRRVLGKGTLAADAGRATATLTLPMPSRGESWDDLEAFIGGERAASLALPNADAARARAFMSAEIQFRPYVFTSAAFPQPEFEQPSLVEDLIGPYQLRTTFYDREYRKVTTAETPGRYGAVIEVIPEKGRPSRRYRTLFRQPEAFSWWSARIPATIALPQATGVAPEVLGTQSRTVADFVKELFFDRGVQSVAKSAAFLAGLHETPAGSPEASFADNVWARDRQWWVGLKRKLSGMDARSPAVFDAPRPANGSSGKALREGSAAEAGMKPDAASAIDAVCREWAADSDEGFAVCLARRGVIFHHQAYGRRDGRPMTVTDKSWMASISKLLAGAQILMLVDQGRVSLDEPVETYLPALRGQPVGRKVTLRHLLTHTAGLWDHWGDDLHDFEERVADFLPYLEVQERYEYNGASFAVAGKVLEMVTGEAQPQFTQRHLFEPLGCRDTEMTTLSWATWSTPLDMARIGQMLLNKGSYGPYRFFSETTFNEMLPRPLAEQFGPKISAVYSLGTGFFDGEGLGKGTWGHGAASSATLRIDPENELVVVMTRETAGRNFGTYHPRFMKAIAAGIAR